jgi:hypothetical protein
MTELPPEQPSPAEPQPERHPHHPPDPAIMPRWVPVLIGAVLVTIAALAVITGMRYRDNTLVRMVSRSTTPRVAAPAPPGEPEPGASRVMSGNEGGDVPAAHEPAAGESHADVTGDAGGVTAVVRMWARRGMQVKTSPTDAVVYVNNVAIGQARQFDTEDEAYDFAAPGSYTVRLIAPGYKERTYVVTASEDAEDEVAHIDARLEKQ